MDESRHTVSARMRKPFEAADSGRHRRRGRGGPDQLRLQAHAPEHHARLESIPGQLRAKKFDDWCADFLSRNPDAVVLHLGCGLDGRAFRLDLPPSVSWFDVDQPSVIGLRRQLYDDTERYRMIGSSVTELRWLDDVPAGRPTLVVAEGLLMYLHEEEVRRLVQGLIDRFPGGEMHFDTLSALAPVLSKVFTRGIITWGIRDARRLAAWHPRLRFLEQAPALAGYEHIRRPRCG